MAVDIKQLRIGSYVLLTRENKRVRITGITKRKIGYHRRADRTDNLAYARLNEIEPIPITSELLVELGFEHGSDEREWHKEIGEAWVGIHLFLDRERMRVYVCDDRADYGNLIVRYLHELENFIYLTLGKELIEE